MPETQPPRAPHPGPDASETQAFSRAASLERLAGEEFDVLVIGGGVTGCGVALDAAARGLRTALVERHDFASGTSSKSSKMIHGGLRYLQQHDFRLVYEALHERQRLIENAPHLVAPLPFLIPLFGNDGVVQKGVARTYATALWLYDVTGGLRIGRRHRRISRDETVGHFPTMRTERLVAAFVYYDAQADDARLTLTLARSAADHGAVVANYCPVTELLRARGRVAGARVHPAVGVPGAQLEKEIEIRAKVVVNAAGVWAGVLPELEEAERVSIRPAKGVHLSVPRAKLPADIAAVIPVPRDRRSIFLVPWPDGDDVYLGTTDTDWDGSFDDPACLPDDVAYILGAANAVLSSSLEPADVRGVWAGLRPLLAPPGRKVSDRTADLSRRHRVLAPGDGLVTVTGGKLTTYRKMAEDTIDAVVGELGIRGAGAHRSPTRRLALHGAAGTAELREPGAEAGLGVDAATLAALVARHGGETPAVLDLANGRPELLEPLVPGLSQLRVEALWAVRHEMAMTLDDVLARRTRALLRRGDDTAAAAGAIAGMLGDTWGRDAKDVSAEAAAFAAAARGDLERAGVRTRDAATAPATDLDPAGG